MTRKKENFIQKALKKNKEGSLHRQLGITENDKIPVGFLNKIKNSEIGIVVKNPSKKGKKQVKVTGLLKKRAVLAVTLRRMKH